MAACPVCGGVNFEKHAGYLYCMECQTQSQDYQEEEYEFGEHDRTLTSNVKKGSRRRSKKKTDIDIGTSTSWDIFNHILYGMTQELKLICKTVGFDVVVLQLWSCYLNQLEAGFTSITKEDMPKLRYCYRRRDAKILYNFDALSTKSSKKSSSKKSRSKSHDSQSSSMNDSKRSQSVKRRKIADSDYEEQMSSQTLDTSLADETIESLGRSNSEISLPLSDEDALSAAKEFFTKDAYKCHKLGRKSPKDFNDFKTEEIKTVKYLTKNKLLAIIHLALLLTSSDIYLSDLLRFIREGHLSFAKVTHFLPSTMKILKVDMQYIDSVSNSFMPTHLHQRQLCNQMAVLLKIEEITYPDVIALFNRYCKELKLPDKVRAYGTKILKLVHKEDVIKIGPKKLIPNFEGIAMAAIIFVLKFYFGLDDKTERVLSNTARSINRIIGENENHLFVFEDWQKYIECRKTIIKDFHYPTQEQFSDDSCSSKKFIEMLMKETKDEFRNERFVDTNSQTLLKDEFLTGVKDVLTSMSEEKEHTALDFKPSQTPQESYLKTILEGCTSSQDPQRSSERSQQQKFPWKILSSDFSKCSINFGVKPDRFIKLLENEHFKVVRLTRTEFLNQDLGDSSKSVENNEIHFIDCSASYWTLLYSNKNDRELTRFRSEMLDKMPYNFQWLLSECARLAEINLSDLYKELRKIEHHFIRDSNTSFR